MPDDLRWRVGTSDHPKVIRLIATCGERAFRALTHLWEYVSQHRPDGNLRGMDATDVAIAAGWPEAPANFVETLRSVRLVDGAPPRARVHDWAENQPWVVGAQARSEGARDAAVKRWAAFYGMTVEEYLERGPRLDAKRMRAACAPHAPRMRTAMRNRADRNAPSPSPSGSSGSPSGDPPDPNSPPPPLRGAALVPLKPDPETTLALAWNELASSRHLPGVRVPLTATVRSRLHAFLAEADDVNHARRALEDAAERYADFVAKGGKAYGLANAIRPGNRDQYLDAARLSPTVDRPGAPDDLSDLRAERERDIASARRPVARPEHA